MKVLKKRDGNEIPDSFWESFNTEQAPINQQVLSNLLASTGHNSLNSGSLYSGGLFGKRSAGQKVKKWSVNAKNQGFLGRELDEFDPNSWYNDYDDTEPVKKRIVKRKVLDNEHSSSGSESTEQEHHTSSDGVSFSTNLNNKGSVLQLLDFLAKRNERAKPDHGPADHETRTPTVTEFLSWLSKNDAHRPVKRSHDSQLGVQDFLNWEVSAFKVKNLKVLYIKTHRNTFHWITNKPVGHRGFKRSVSDDPEFEKRGGGDFMLGLIKRHQVDPSSWYYSLHDLKEGLVTLTNLKFHRPIYKFIKPNLRQ